MDTTNSSFSKFEKALSATLIVVAMLVTTVAVIPNLRAKVKALFDSSDRQILAKVHGKLSGDLFDITILKISSPDGLSLEIYAQEQQDGSLKQIGQFNLNDKRDAFFSFQGNATNLALTDVDNDGTLEIVAPTYDDQMAAHLNVFKYNSTIKSFERMTNAPIQ